MATSLSVQESALTVEPGQTVSTQLRVRNTGEVVDQFSFQPLGDAAPWLTVDPPTVRLFPDTDQLVTVKIAPPREPGTKPGVTAWAVKAIPQEDPQGSATAEGTVDVGEFVEINAELQPVNGRGRLTGRFEVAVDNHGNVPVPVRLLGTDADQVLEFDVKPAAIETAPGSAHFSKVAIKPPSKIWRGTPKTHPFQLVVDPQARAVGTTTDELPAGVGPDAAGAEPGAVAAPPTAPPLAPPVVLAGNFVQEAIIPKWLWKAVLALIVALIALWILWQTLLKPQVESAARAVAIEEVEQVAEEVATLSTEVAQAAETAEAAQAAAEEAGGGGGGGAPETTAPPAGEGGEETPPESTVPGGDGSGEQPGGPVIRSDSVPTSFRLVVDTAAGSTGAASSTAQPAGTTLAITDMILQNPSGDIGTITVSIGDQAIVAAALQSIATTDYHQVSPWIVAPGQSITVTVACATDQIVTADPCQAAVSFSGYLTTETSE